MSDNKRKKSHYKQQSGEKRRKFGCLLESGMKGFMVTFNGIEKAAVNEIFALLDEYHIKPAQSSAVVPEANSQEEDESEDLESALKKECEALRGSADKSSKKNSPKVTDSGLSFLRSNVNNVFFIRIPDTDDPRQLAYRMFDDLMANRAQKSRFVARVIPTQKTCRADVNVIQEGIAQLFAAEFPPPTEGTEETATKGNWTYAVQIKIRNNAGMKRDDVISPVCDVIQTLFPQAKVDLKHPVYTISIEVLQKVACLSLLTKYYHYRKYNIQEVGAGEKIQSETTAKEEGHSTV